MSKYNLLGKEITFSKAEDNFYELQSFLWEATDKTKKAYALWYEAQGNIANIINNGEHFVDEIINQEVLTPLYPKLAKDYEIYGVGKDEYIRTCMDTSAIDNILKNAIEIYNNIQEQLEAEIEEREFENEMRKAGQISFGIGDSLKNAASNAVHGIAKGNGNASSREAANRRKQKLYKDIKEPLWSSIKDIIVTVITNYQTFVNNQIPGCIAANFSYDNSIAYLDNAKSVPEKRDELIVEAFRSCPWNYEMYKYIFEQYSYERRNILEIAKYYDVSLTDEVDAYLRSEYVGNAKTDENAALIAKAKIKNTMLEWGVERSIVIDEIEIDCLERLTADYKTATEERCNELKEILETYDAHSDNKKSYFERIQKRIEEIWAKEDGEIFDNYLMQADILSSKVIEEGKAYIKEKGRTSDSEKYYKALEACTISNIKKARLFNLLNKTTVSMWIFKLLGIVLIIFGWIYAAFVEELTFIDTLPLLLGVAYQIFYINIKKKWTIITIKGEVVNSIITLPHKEFESKRANSAKESNTYNNNNK